METVVFIILAILLIVLVAGFVAQFDKNKKPVVVTETPVNSDYNVTFDPATPADGKSLKVEPPHFDEPVNIEQRAYTPTTFNNVWYINRYGKQWEDEEIEQYKNRFENGESLESISVSSGRSVRLLKSKLK